MPEITAPSLPWVAASMIAETAGTYALFIGRASAGQPGALDVAEAKLTTLIAQAEHAKVEIKLHRDARALLEGDEVAA